MNHIKKTHQKGGFHIQSNELGYVANPFCSKIQALNTK